jgi:cytochrome c-type biogenesis protein CcmH/NrfG
MPSISELPLATIRRSGPGPKALPLFCLLLLLCSCRNRDQAPQAVVEPTPASPAVAPLAPAPSSTPAPAPDSTSSLPTSADLSAAQKAVRNAPRSGEARFKLGVIQVALGQTADGVNSLREAARLLPDSPVPDAYLERIYQQAGYIDWELDALRHLVAIHSRDPLVYLRLAQIYSQLNWQEPAGPAIRKALELSPDSPDVQREMATYEFDTGQTHAAIKRLEDMHKRDPKDALATSLLAQYLLTLNGDAEAEAALRETLRLVPDNVKLKLLLAHTLEHANRSDALPEAAALAQDALKTSPRNVEAYAWLAEADERLGRRDEAQRAYQAAADIDPTFENVALKLGRIDLHAGNRAEGERLSHLYQMLNTNSITYGVARDYVHHHFNDPKGHIAMGDWYVKIKAYASAISEYKEALRLRPADPSTRSKLLATLTAAGRTREAQRLRSTASL